MKTFEYVDLRSDTVTLPTREMREFMMNAPVGDDVMQEDPSINKLEAYVAQICDRQAALFVPSGTMANQIAVKVYGGPGTEILVVDQSHIFFYEVGSAAGLSGVQLHPIPSKDGIFDGKEFEARIRPPDPHFPKTVAFWIENTHNRGGGKIIPYQLMQELKEIADKNCIPVHMDGARICNASVATGIPLKKWARLIDSFSICFSKGLGAPVGSILVGDVEFIARCRVARKALGGGMRQAGFLAAAAMFSMKHQFKRLAYDHQRARKLASELTKLPGVHIENMPDTNIVMIDIDQETSLTGVSMVKKLAEEGVKLFDIAPMRLRAVTNIGVDDEQIEQAINAFRKILK